MEKQIALSYSTANHFFAHETRPLVIQLLFSTTPISGNHLQTQFNFQSYFNTIYQAVL